MLLSQSTVFGVFRCKLNYLLVDVFFAFLVLIGEITFLLSGVLLCETDLFLGCSAVQRLLAHAGQGTTYDSLRLLRIDVLYVFQTLVQ